MDAIVMIGEQLEWERTHPVEHWWERWCSAWWWIGFRHKYG